MQHLLKLSFVRNRMYARAVEQFINQQEGKGILMRNMDVPERLCGLRTMLVDASLAMQGRDEVRQVAAPLEPCALDKLRRQPSWMVLTAGISLGCEGYAPLENFATGMSFARERMLRQFPQVAHMPYDDARRVETTVHRDAGGVRAYVKGGAEDIVARCSHVLDGRERPMDAGDRGRAVDVARQMERDGLKTLAFATAWRDAENELEENLVFLGIVGMGDLPDAHAPRYMEALRGEGVRPILVAGGDITPGALGHTGALRPTAGYMSRGEFDLLEDMALREAAVHADAYLGMDWRRRGRLAKALRMDGAVGVLTPDGRGGLVLALGDGAMPDVALERGGMQPVIRLLRDCKALVGTYAAKEGRKESAL